MFLKPSVIENMFYCFHCLMLSFAKVGYAIAGALLFIEIEGNAVKEVTLNFTKHRNETAKRFWNLTISMNVFNEKMWRENISVELLHYQRETIEAIRAGFDGDDVSEYSKQWSISGAFLYSLTVITTIGELVLFQRPSKFEQEEQ